VQNARARKRTEFPDAFSPLMAEAIQTAYRSSAPEIQGKIRRVIEVWRTRNVFETPILEAIESRVDEVDRAKGGGPGGVGGGKKKTLMGQSLLGGTGSMPKELETLAPLQVAVTKETITARPLLDAAQAEYGKLNDEHAVLPSPPVHAARLSSLIKSLAAAESSVSASIKARKALIADLERILDVNKTALAKDEENFSTIDSRKASTEAKKREVEDAIIRGLTSAEAASSANTTAIGIDTDPSGTLPHPGFENEAATTVTASEFLSARPEIEQLTDDEGDYYTTGAFDQDLDHPPVAAPTSAPAPIPPESSPPPTRNPALAAALAEFTASGGPGLVMPGLEQDYSAFLPSGTHRARAASGSGTNGLSAKRRKTSHGAEDAQVPDLVEMDMDMEGIGLPGLGQMQQQGQAQRQGAEGLAGLHADVEELIRQEGGGM
jgi:regulator of Ty1 transposition protein 103